MFNAREIFSEWLAGDGLGLKILVIIFSLLTLFLGLLELYQARVACGGQKTKNASEVSKTGVLKFSILFLLVAFCARGRLGQHHLRREDSQITHNAGWNELVLNATWSFSKDDR